MHTRTKQPELQHTLLGHWRSQTWSGSYARDWPLGSRVLQSAGLDALLEPHAARCRRCDAKSSPQFYTEQVAKLLLLSKHSWFWDDAIIPSSSHTQDSYCSFCKQKDETKQCQKPSKTFKTSQKNSCLRCASLHVIPIGDNAMLDWVLQCQHTSLALGFISNIAVLLVHANHNSGHLWSADDGWENCSRSIITSKTSLAHSTSVVHHQSSHLFVTHGYKLRLTTVNKLDKLESHGDLGKITWATSRRSDFVSTSHSTEQLNLNQRPIRMLLQNDVAKQHCHAIFSILPHQPRQHDLSNKNESANVLTRHGWGKSCHPLQSRFQRQESKKVHVKPQHANSSPT